MSGKNCSCESVRGEANKIIGKLYWENTTLKEENAILKEKLSRLENQPVQTKVPAPLKKQNRQVDERMLADFFNQLLQKNGKRRKRSLTNHM